MKKVIFTIILEAGTGFGVAGIYDVIIKEGIHGMFVLVFGVITSVAVHFTNKILNKYNKD